MRTTVINMIGWLVENTRVVEITAINSFYVTTVLLIILYAR